MKNVTDFIIVYQLVPTKNIRQQSLVCLTESENTPGRKGMHMKLQFLEYFILYTNQSFSASCSKPSCPKFSSHM